MTGVFVILGIIIIGVLLVGTYDTHDDSEDDDFTVGGGWV